MPRLLALDLSTMTGFAVMERGRAPHFGTWRAPPETVGEYGRRYSALRQWLVEMHQVHQLDGIAFEAPIMKPTDDMHMLRVLIGFAVIVEEVAGSLKLECVEVPVPTVKKALTGDAYAKKDKMIAAACRRGWAVADDHQADAGAVGLVAFQTLWPTKRSDLA